MTDLYNTRVSIAGGKWSRIAWNTRYLTSQTNYLLLAYLSDGPLFYRVDLFTSFQRI